MRYAVLALVAIVAIGLALISTSPIDAATYQPTTAIPMTGPLAPNNRLAQAQHLADGKIVGPEDIAQDAQGRLYAGTQDGKIVRLLPDGTPEAFATTGGRPLGIRFDASGNLIVADAWKGLLSINPQGQISTLTTAANGEPFLFTNALEIASDGKIYFTDSSRFHQPDWMLDAFEAKPWGRLLCYDPANQSTSLIMKDLNFPNGVALSKDEDFLVINETFRYRMLRLWLKGPKAGTQDIFIDNLPGFPDGVSSDHDGQFWVAIPTIRNMLLDTIHPYPRLKELVAALPKSLSPKPQPYGLIIRINEKGRITDSLHDSSGTVVSQVTSVRQLGNSLVMGSLEQTYVAKVLAP